MNLYILEAQLAELQVPAAYFCLNGEQHESLCILNEDARWKVFLSERGARYEERAFRSEEEACEFFLARVMQLWRA